MSLIQRFERNTAGRDFGVGDIHGHFTRLRAALDAAGFDPSRDRLFSVGDLVDRGPESADVDEWLRQPWFHAVRGNHEQMTIDAYRANAGGAEGDLHFANGGAWFYGLPDAERGSYAQLLADLPLVIEVETAAGLVGLVHADCPRGDWYSLLLSLEGGLAEAEHVAAMCQWSRARIQSENTAGVTGIRAVVVGHTPLRQPAVLGNVWHIDTAGWMGGHFTLLDLASLECIPPINQKLHWDWEVPA